RVPTVPGTHGAGYLGVSLRARDSVTRYGCDNLQRARGRTARIYEGGVGEERWHIACSSVRRSGCSVEGARSGDGGWCVARLAVAVADGGFREGLRCVGRVFHRAARAVRVDRGPRRRSTERSAGARRRTGPAG